MPPSSSRSPSPAHACCGWRSGPTRGASASPTWRRSGATRAGSSAPGATSCERTPAAMRRRSASASRSAPAARRPRSGAPAPRTLLNLAFPPTTPWTLLCPYDAERLPDEVLEGALHNHPHVTEHGETHRSSAFARAIPDAAPLPAPAADPTVLRFTHGDLAFVREFIGRHAAAEGFDRSRVSDLVWPSTSSPPTASATPAARARCASGARTARCSSRSPTRVTSRTRWPAATALNRRRSAAAGCTWSTSSAISCRCARRRTAA